MRFCVSALLRSGRMCIGDGEKKACVQWGIYAIIDMKSFGNSDLQIFHRTAKAGMDVSDGTGN